MFGDLEKETPVANIPIMVKSKYCTTNIKQSLLGECKYEPGGYFIVTGQEKVVMSIEKMVDNKIINNAFNNLLKYYAIKIDNICSYIDTILKMVIYHYDIYIIIIYIIFSHC